MAKSNCYNCHRRDGRGEGQKDTGGVLIIYQQCGKHYLNGWIFCPGDL